VAFQSVDLLVLRAERLQALQLQLVDQFFVGELLDLVCFLQVQSAALELRLLSVSRAYLEFASHAYSY